MLIADIYARNVLEKRKRRHCSYSPLAYNSGGRGDVCTNKWDTRQCFQRKAPEEFTEGHLQLGQGGELPLGVKAKRQLGICAGRTAGAVQPAEETVKSGSGTGICRTR